MIPSARFYRRFLSLRVLLPLLFSVASYIFLFQAQSPFTLPFIWDRSPYWRSRCGLRLSSDGLASGYTAGGIHPIEELVQKGREIWNGLLRRQSKTLQDAVREYERRYGRDPPRGFDRWWAWAQENQVRIVDDYDQVYRDTQLYWALPPLLLRRRLKALQDEPSTFTLHLSRIGSVEITGPLSTNFRAQNLRNLLSPVVHLLPDDLDITVSTHDLGSGLLTAEHKAFLEGKIVNGEHATMEELEMFERLGTRELKGLASVCPEESPAWRQAIEALRDPEQQTPGPRPLYHPSDDHHPDLIHNHLSTFDYCDHPDLLQVHGALSWDQPRLNALRPLFQQSKLLRNPELLLTPLDYYYNATDRGGQDQYVPWEEKTIDKLHWRGKATGDAYSKRNGYNWLNSHRIRLHSITHTREGTSQILVRRANGKWVEEAWSNEDLNKAYTDVGLIGPPHQCNTNDGTCDEMQEQIEWTQRVEPKQAAKYKYAIDVDGNGWSSRFHRLMLSGSVIFKSTIYPEHYTDWMIPWVHYIPLKVSYSELHLILSFFIGPPDGPRRLGRDDLAREIAENGVTFARDFWRWEDMQSYMIRLLLELSRLTQDERDDWSYKG